MSDDEQIALQSYREVVAKIIDPNAFTEKAMGLNGTWARRRKDAYGKADRIITLQRLLDREGAMP